MITKIVAYPDPFISNLSLEITSDSSQITVIRMIDEAGKIIRMMSWTLIKGINKSSFNALDILPQGVYYIDIKNLEGITLYMTKLAK